MKRSKIILMVLSGLIILLQFFQPAQNNPAVNPADEFQTISQAPPEVMQILKTACYDCHSNETVYPWYSRISPVSWWLNNHIVEGREHLNFSTFGQYSFEDIPEIMEELEEVLRKNEMPLDSYTWIHGEAKLSEAQKGVIYDWLAGRGE